MQPVQRVVCRLACLLGPHGVVLFFWGSQACRRLSFCPLRAVQGMQTCMLETLFLFRPVLGFYPRLCLTALSHGASPGACREAFTPTSLATHTLPSWTLPSQQRLTSTFMRSARWK